MTPKTLNRYNLKWPVVKNFFLRSSQNILEIYLVKGFYKKAVLGVQSKCKSFYLVVVIFCVYFGWLRVIQYMTPRRPIGVRRGRGALMGVPPASYWLPGNHILTPSRMASHFF